MNELETRTLQNIIEFIPLIFATIGLIKLIILLIKNHIGLLLILMITVVSTILSLTMTPIPLTLFGVFTCIQLILKLFRFFKKSNKNTEPKINMDDENSIYLKSEIGAIRIANPYRGIIVQGGAGSGKSKSLFYPIIEQLISNNFSGVLYDFKSPELSEFAHASAKKNDNINFAFLDFKDFRLSDRINPLNPKYVSKQAIAFEMASVLINNLLPESIKKKDYWSRSSISVIAGAIWFLRNNHPNKCTLPHLIAMILSFPSVSLIDVISRDLECLGMISSIREAHEQGAEKQLAGVVGTIKNALAQLNIPEVFYLLSADNVNLDLNNPKEPTFLCIGNDSTLSTTYAPIISLVVSACLRKMNEPNKTKSAIILDETPTLYIPNLEQIPATARSNKIATIIGLQDYSQMVDKYGEDKAQVLLSNLGNQFYGRTVNERSAKRITALYGKADKVYKSSSTSRGSSSGGFMSGHSSNNNNHSVSQSVQERERVKISDITNLSAGKFYGVIAEGNHSELLGVQLGQIEPQYLKFEPKNNANPKEVFKAIYEDVKHILNPVEKIESIDKNNIKIELN